MLRSSRRRSEVIYAERGFLRPTIGDPPPTSADPCQTVNRPETFTIFIGNLPPLCRARELRLLIDSAIGPVRRVYVPRRPARREATMAVAAVTFHDAATAENAAEILCHARIDGHRTLVRRCEPFDTLRDFHDECSALILGCPSAVPHASFPPSLSPPPPSHHPSRHRR